MSPHPMPPTIPSAGETAFLIIVVVFAAACAVIGFVLHHRADVEGRGVEQELRDAEALALLDPPADEAGPDAPGRAWCPPSPAPGQAATYPPRPAGYRGIHRPHNGSPR